MSGAALEARVAAALAGADLLGARICVALSGGIDSCVLLDLLARLARQHPLRLSAVHVDHGLSPHSHEWAGFCRARCHAYGIELQVSCVRLDVRTGVEAAARAARYAAFSGLQVDAVALAHNLDDQLETVLMRLNRGAGVHGLSGMPEVRPLTHGMRLVRPLLRVARRDIVSHAREHGLAWVDDESNERPEFDRNYVRLELLPRVEARFPGYRHTWSRAAANLAESAELLDDLARADAGREAGADAVSLAKLRALTPARGRNLLRWYLAGQGVSVPARERLEEARRQLVEAGPGRHPEIAFGELRLRRHGDDVVTVGVQPEIPDGWEVAWSGEEVVPLAYGLGTLHFLPMRGHGLSRARLLDCGTRIGVRTGGERLKLAPGRPSRTLKNLLRECRIPAWQRARLPALRAGGQLAWVARVGMDCRFAAAADEAGVIPHWEPAPH